MCSDQFKNTYYKDYEALELHFKKTHYVCPYEACKSKCYVAFRAEQELQAHLDIVHRGIKTTNNANALLSFSTGGHEDPAENDRDSGRGGRGGGRGGRGGANKQAEVLKDDIGVDFSFYFSEKYNTIHKR